MELWVASLGLDGWDQRGEAFKFVGWKDDKSTVIWLHKRCEDSGPAECAELHCFLEKAFLPLGESDLA